ncbi:YbhB/YbcL family Raf kinase inhibitor-like protein [Leucobacter sp. 1207-22]|uniref:YbhB/YbcL family Raf kinase inhibitor-like protein n=1 Tax=Leucobacter sp. 1207-22 TaxID=2604456 RepID=UPI00406403A5
MSQVASRGPANPYALMRQVPEFTLTSATIQAGEPMPAELYAEYAGGSNQSPQLSWSDVPEGTQSFAITAYDPDAPTGSGFWHWAVANIPADVRELQVNAGALGGAGLPTGAYMLRNEKGEPAFTGAAPPEHTGVHHYWFVVHALNVAHIDVPADVTPAVQGFMMRDAVIGRAILVATGEYGQAV